MAIKEKVGIVVNNLMNKTIIIAVENKYPHPIYGKTIKKTKRFMAHDEENNSNNITYHTIIETRPLSKNKRWLAIQILIKIKGSN
jgi:small subunit ribosomal protein S17